jgi:hypothetical protein
VLTTNAFASAILVSLFFLDYAFLVLFGFDQALKFPESAAIAAFLTMFFMLANLILQVYGLVSPSKAKAIFAVVIEVFL